MKKSTLFLTAAGALLALTPSLFAGGGGMQATPDGGTTILFLGGAFGCLAVVRRFFRR